MASDLERLFEQETVDIITDLVGKQHANSGTTCRVVEDHLKQLLRNIERLRKGDGEREAIAWASPGQFAALRDPEAGEGGGAYLPVRKSPAGNFTMPLYGAALTTPNDTPAKQVMDREAVLNDIAVMMSEFVDNWPNPKKISAALALIAKTMRAALDSPVTAKTCDLRQRAQEILAAQYQRDDHHRAESILMGLRDKRAVDAVEAALSLASPAVEENGEDHLEQARKIADRLCADRDEFDPQNDPDDATAWMYSRNGALAALSTPTAPVSQEALDAAADWYDNGGAEQMRADVKRRPYAEFREEVMAKATPTAPAVKGAGVVTCPICHDTDGREHCAVCSNCGHLTDAEAAVWLRANHISDMRNMVPEGWALVPREPTEAMIEAGIQELPWGQQSPVTVSKCWSAMIAAAPTAKESGK